jgi:hypothetical protein
MDIVNLGFFREFPHGDPNGESIKPCLAKGDAAVKDLVAGYLEQGSTLAATAQRVFDVLDENKPDAGALAMITDGAWIWPADLPYYVRKYNISLPVKFVEHAKRSNWKPAEVSHQDLVDIENALFAG